MISMRTLLRRSGSAVVIAVFMAGAATSEPASRIVSVGGSVTEIVYALGQEHRLVARDTTSSWPEKAVRLPDVGYMRALSAEGVLSVAPDLIIAEDGSGPPEAIDVLRAANVDFVTVPDGFNRAAVVGKITAVADALGVPEAGDKLAQDVDAKLQKAEDAAADVSTPKRVLFILSMQGGRILASGANTAADGIITMAGGVNAMTEFDGYKPLTDEAVSAIAPDVILMMARGGDHALDDKGLFQHPALIVTPAAKTQSIIRMDGLLLLGFGPRTAEAVAGLSHALYPEG